MVLYFVSPAISKSLVLKSLLPVSTNEYWYFTAYFLVLLVRPLLNRIINDTPLTVLLPALSVSVFAVMMQGMFFNVYGVSAGHSTVWLAMLYLIGGAAARYGEKIKVVCFIKRHCVAVFTVGCLMTFGSFVLLHEAVQYSHNTIVSLMLEALSGMNKSTFLFNLVSPTVLGCGLSVLFFCENREFSALQNKLIHFFAPCSFATYLIHINYAVFELYWRGSFSAIAELPLLLIPFVIVGSAILIFVALCLVDRIRMRIFKLLRINNFSQQAETIFERVISDHINHD